MVSCDVCGQEFTRADALSRHRRGGACLQRQALAVLDRFQPSTTTTTAVVGHGGGKRIPAVVVEDDVVVAKRQYDHDRALAEIRRKQRYDRNANMRKFGIALCILGVAVYFMAGGKLKLPFFGDLNNS